MQSPYGMELVENCLACNLCGEGFFCRLPAAEMEAFQKIKFTLAYPAGATLFVEGQVCRGIYVLCKGRVKVSATSTHGQTLIFKIAKPGEVLGLNDTVSGTVHTMTAETGQACQLNFVKKADFLEFLAEYRGASLRAAVHLSHEAQRAYQQLRSFVMRSAPGRVARMMLDWSVDEAGMATRQGIKVALTHDEIGQIIGMSRETVTRTLADFRKQRIAVLHGSTLQIQDAAALRQLAAD